MNSKPVVLTFNRHYLPGYRAGGPIRTLSNIVDRLGKEIDFRIVTLDHDSRTNELFSDIVYNEWNAVGLAQVFYFNLRSISIRSLVKLFNEVKPDVVYLNSFFDNIFTQRILWARRFGLLGKVPIILAPRGEFSCGALSINKIKKKIYLNLVITAGLYSGLSWHVSSELEQEDLHRTLNFVCRKNVRVAMDLAPAGNQQQIERKVRKNGGPLRVCFLSRISPMKNLDFALKVLAQVKSSIVFTIYGPKEVASSYWAECESLIASCPPNIKVIYEGEVHPQAVKPTLAQHDLFFFPTRGENYGHVIHEALSAGLPVLISDQTPWNEVRKREVGWVFPLSSLDFFVEAIQEASNWTAEEHAAITRRAHSFAIEKATDSDVLVHNRNLFMNIIAGANQ